MKLLLILLVGFLIACSVQQTGNSSTKTLASSAQKANKSTVIVQESGKNVNVVCEAINGKVVLIYPNKQKETFSPSCPGKDSPEFNVFKQEYFCEGGQIKSKVTRCAENQTCNKGVCV